MKRQRSYFTGVSSPFVQPPQAKRSRTTQYKRPVGTPAQRKNARTGGFIGLEKKFLDNNVTAVPLIGTWTGGELDPTAGATLALSAIAQGDGESNRDGRKATLTSVVLNGYINIPQVESKVSPNDDIIVNLAMVLDTQTNGAQLNAEDVFSEFATGPKDVNSYRNLQYVKRFKVLKQKKFCIKVSQAMMNEGGINLFSNGAVKYPFKMSYKFKKPIDVNHSATTATVAAITDNSIHIIGIADPIGAAPTIDYTSRVRFYG